MAQFLSEEDNADGVSGGLLRTYIDGLDAHVDGSVPSSGNWKYYTHDRLGSTRGVWNQDSTPYSKLEYEAFGTAFISIGNGAGIDFRFAGYYWDHDSHLYSMPYRAYSPNGSRWLRRDPLNMPEGPNRYSYVKNNPVMHFDSRGLLREVLGEGCEGADSLNEEMKALLDCLDKGMEGGVILTCGRRKKGGTSQHTSGNAIDLGTDLGGSGSKHTACELAKAAKACADASPDDVIGGLRMCQGITEPHLHIDGKDEPTNCESPRWQDNGKHCTPCK